MKHSDFKIGFEFLTETGRWRCTDVGSRTVAAIRLDLDHDPAWYDGPPYAVLEHVFDEDGIEGCEPAPKDRIFDDSGRAGLVTVRRASRSSPRTPTPILPRNGREGARSPLWATLTLSRHLPVGQTLNIYPIYSMLINTGSWGYHENKK
jgi:hypothetical protein